MEKEIQEVMMNQILGKIGLAAFKGLAPLAGAKSVGILETDTNVPPDNVQHLMLAKEGALFPYDPESGVYMGGDRTMMDNYVFAYMGLAVVVGMLLAGATTAIVMKGMKTAPAARARRRITTVRRVGVRRARRYVKRRTTVMRSRVAARARAVRAYYAKRRR
jgi:hypothetical protein